MEARKRFWRDGPPQRREVQTTDTVGSSPHPYSRKESQETVGSTEPAPSEHSRLPRAVPALLTGGNEGRHSAVKRGVMRQRDQPRKEARGAKRPICRNELGWTRDVQNPALTAWLSLGDRRAGIRLRSEMQPLSRCGSLGAGPCSRAPRWACARKASTLFSPETYPFPSNADLL